MTQQLAVELYNEPTTVNSLEAGQYVLHDGRVKKVNTCLWSRPLCEWRMTFVDDPEEYGFVDDTKFTRVRAVTVLA